jgi:hypothetical protein
MSRWKIALGAAVGYVYVWKEKFLAYRSGYSNGYYQGRMDELEAQGAAFKYMAENGGEISEEETAQIMAQQVIQDPLLDKDGFAWDGIDRLALYK